MEIRFDSPEERKAYWIVLGVIGTVAAGIIISISVVNQSEINAQYGSGFKSRSEAYSKSDNDDSSGYRYSSPGLRESDIKKYKGRFYETY